MYYTGYFRKLKANNSFAHKKQSDGCIYISCPTGRQLLQNCWSLHIKNDRKYRASNAIFKMTNNDQ